MFRRVLRLRRRRRDRVEVFFRRMRDVPVGRDRRMLGAFLREQLLQLRAARARQRDQLGLVAEMRRQSSCSCCTEWRRKRIASVRARCGSKPMASSTLRALMSAESSVSRSTKCTPRSLSWYQCCTLRARATMVRFGKVLAGDVHQLRGWRSMPSMATTSTLGARRARHAQQVEPRRVAVMHPEAELAQRLDLPRRRAPAPWPRCRWRAAAGR